MTPTPENPPPADVPIPPLLSRGFWVMMAFCALCLLGAVAFFVVATSLRAPNRPMAAGASANPARSRGASPIP